MANDTGLINAPNPPEEQSLPLQLDNLAKIVGERPETLATGSEDLRRAALDATKFVYDLALSVEKNSLGKVNEFLVAISPAYAPQTRSQTANGSLKRKRGSNPSPPPRPCSITLMQETPLAELFVEDMNDEQIWAELELRAQNLCDVLDHALDGPALGAIGEDENGDEDMDTHEDEDEDMDSDEERELKKMRQALIDEGFDPQELERLGIGEEDEDEDEDEESDEDDEDEDESEGEDNGEDADLGEDVEGLRDPSDEDEEDDSGLEGSSSLNKNRRALKSNLKYGGHRILDDGFFDLAAFNAETEAAESTHVSRGKLSRDDDDDEDDDAESVDLFAPVDDITTFDEEGLDDRELLYKDFFTPPSGKELKVRNPPKAAGRPSASTSTSKVRFHEEVRVKKIKAQGKNFPVSTMFYEEEDECESEETTDAFGEDQEGSSDVDVDVGEDDAMLDESSEEVDVDSELDMSAEEEGQSGLTTIERLKDDLFAEDNDEPQEGLSTHEKRMAALREEIAALESENIGKKDWTLLGEATARTRPQNSLLEEDLEFERVMKSVPVITEDVVHSLEERIKMRIIENQFNDVVRKRPVDDKPFLSSRLFELQDSKSKQSLAEIYEDEYTAAQTGGIAGEDRDGKLKQEHQEIEKLWDNICNKLDALCNAHFTPKAPKATITSVSNAAAATLESALPSTKTTSAMLAPEEVYAPSSSDLRVRSELTPMEKRALRNKQKKAKKKARDAIEKSVVKFGRPRGTGDVKRQKDAVLKTLVKSGKGVTIVGKKSKEREGKSGRGKT